MIPLYPCVVRQSDDFDASEGVGNARLVSGHVETDTPGSYELVYELADGSTQTRTIVVAAPPTLHLPNGQTIEVSSSFDPYRAVSATDGDGRDISGHIVVLDNPVDIDTEGVYTVSYAVADRHGFVASGSQQVEVYSPTSHNRIREGA